MKYKEYKKNSNYSHQGLLGAKFLTGHRNILCHPTCFQQQPYRQSRIQNQAENITQQIQNSSSQSRINQVNKMKLNGKRLLMSADPSSFLSLISLCNFNFHKIKLDIKFQVITHVQLIVQQSTQDGRQAHSITKLQSANPAQSPPSYSELK